MPPRLSVRARRAGATVAGLALVALHLDAWRAQRVVLYFGWLPEELLYRLAWMLAAWALLLWVVPAGARAEAETARGPDGPLDDPAGRLEDDA